MEHRGRKVGRRRWEGGKERSTTGAWESTREGAEEERKSQSVEGEDGVGGWGVRFSRMRQHLCESNQREQMSVSRNQFQPGSGRPR